MREKKRPLISVMLWLIFLLHCFAVVFLLYLSRSHPGDIRAGGEAVRANLVPLHTIAEYIFMFQTGPRPVAMRNLLGNALLLAPLGMLLPLLFKRMRKWCAFLLCVIPLTFLLEGIQAFFALGVFDIDDVILNFGGAAAGYAAVRLGMRVFRGRAA